MITEAEKKFLIRYAIYRLIGLFTYVLYFYIIDNVNYLDIGIMIILPFAVYQLLDGFSPLCFQTSIILLVYKYLFGGDDMDLYMFFIFLSIISFAIIYDEMDRKHILIFIYKLIKRKIKGSDTNE